VSGRGADATVESVVKREEMAIGQRLPTNDDF
jgi:hypothetical protein